MSTKNVGSQPDEGPVVQASVRRPAEDLGPRARRTIGKILDATRTVFMSHGYAGTTIEEIARVAGISRASVYTYFPTKRDVLLALGANSAEAGEAVVQSFLDQDGSRGREEVRRFVDEYMAVLDVHGAFAFAWTQAAQADGAIRNAGMARHLKMCRQLGEYVCPLGADSHGNETRGLVAFAMIERAWSYLQLYGDSIDAGSVHDEITEILHQGMHGSGQA